MIHVSSTLIAMWANDPRILIAVAAAVLALLVPVTWLSFYLSAKLADDETIVKRIDALELPSKVRPAFELATPKLNQAGFREIGIFLTTRRGIKMYDRKFFDAQCQIVADLSFSSGFLSSSGPSTSLVTVFEDGTYLESSSHNPAIVPQFFMDGAVLVVNPCNTGEVMELTRLHRLEVDRIMREQLSSPLTLEESVLPKLMQYGLQLADWKMHQAGIWAEPPTFDWAPQENVELQPVNA